MTKQTNPNASTTLRRQKLHDGTSILYDQYPESIYDSDVHRDSSMAADKTNWRALGWNDSPMYVVLLAWLRHHQRGYYFACRDYYNLPHGAGVYGPQLNAQISKEEYAAWHKYTGATQVYSDPVAKMDEALIGRDAPPVEFSFSRAGKQLLAAQCEQIGLPAAAKERARLALRDELI